MTKDSILKDIGEPELIRIIEKLVFEKSGKEVIRDDSFFYSVENLNSNNQIVFNSDMLVSTTDVPDQMNYYQIGRKSVLMNISDLIVKGVIPRGIIVSLGLPDEIKLKDFKDLINGIIDYCIKWKLDYIGGDLNVTKEIIINPTVFGFEDPSKIIHRTGLKVGDYLVINKKFGLTGVGFDILLNKGGILSDFPSYKKSIKSVLEIEDLDQEASILARNKFATASIDSSDGLAKSLSDLMLSNLKIGFEIEFNDNLIDIEAMKYSKEYNVSLEKLIFDAGEEFIHIFTIDPKNYKAALNITQDQGGQLFKVGKVISEEKIYILKNNEKVELKTRGFEHFT